MVPSGAVKKALTSAVGGVKKKQNYPQLVTTTQFLFICIRPVTWQLNDVTMFQFNSWLDPSEIQKKSYEMCQHWTQIANRLH